MAEETVKNVTINVNGDEFLKIMKEILLALQETNKQVDKVEKTAKKSEKGLSSMSKGLKSVGTALKGLGIVTVIVKAFDFLKDAFMRNEKVSKAFNTGMQFISIVMDKIVNTVVKVVEKIVEMSSKMDGTKAVIKDLITIGLTPLKLSFYTIQLAVKELILGWTQLFDRKNTDKIKTLTDDVKELKTNLKETAVNAGNAAVDFTKNIGKAVNEVGNVAKETGKIISDGYKNFDATTEMNNAKRLAQAKEYYGKLAAEAEKDIKRLEGEAEVQRQLRDNTDLSYEDRQKTVEKLAQLNQEQYEASVKLANAHIGLAKAELEKDKANVDAKNAVIAAEGELEDAEANLQSKRSEAQAASLGLSKEQFDGIKNLSQAERDALFEEQKIEANRIKNDEDRIKRLKEIEDAEYEANKKSLEDSMAGMEKNSQAYITAQTELVNLTKTHNSTMATLDDGLTKVKEDNVQKLNDLKKTDMDNDKLSYETRIQSANEYYDALIKKAQETGQTTTDIEKQKNDAINALELERKQKAIDTAQQSIDSIRNIDEQYTQFKQNLLQNQLKNGQITQEQFDKKSAELEKKAAQRKKAYAIGDAIISTAQSIIGFLAKPGGIPGVVLSVAAGVLGAAQIATIASTPVDGTASGGSSPSGSISSGGQSTAPTTSFSFAEAPKTTEQPVVKTYVIAKDVETQRQLDRQTINNGTI